MLEILQPRRIIEIGSEAGENTALLLEHCRRNDIVLHTIDPAPLFDVDAVRREYGATFEFHQATSLVALPEIEPADVVLVDGDHNWYTVHSELALLEQTAAEAGVPFPLVLVHDIHWPYGRRDLYYDPDAVPPEHRQPYQRKGMLLGQDELCEDGGFNAGLNHAASARTPRNGVLTAVEDFLQETSLSLKILTIPGFHGLAMLLRDELVQTHTTLMQFLSSWNLPPAVRRYVEQLEATRIHLDMTLQELWPES